MLHLNHIRTKIATPTNKLMKKASGRYYTGEAVGRRLAQVAARALAASWQGQHEIHAVDPFGGDGRLLVWLVEAWIDLSMPQCAWRLELWDLNNADFIVAKAHIELLRNKGIDVTCEYIVADAFQRAINSTNTFDIVITNPPWELLKPDRRETECLQHDVRKAYVADMRRYDSWLAEHYPLSQPRRKFAGWGTNLSRVGLELSVKLTGAGGILGIVIPASLLADDQSLNIRKHLIADHRILDIAYYAAEMKLYECADVASATLVAETYRIALQAIPIHSYTQSFTVGESTRVTLDFERLSKFDFSLPISFGAQAAKLISELYEKFPTWGELEADRENEFWAGREIDETGSNGWLVPIHECAIPFLKGRMIDRYQVRDTPVFGVGKIGWTPPNSIKFERIAWRDVSRPNQKRRIIATLVPSGWALGNSLGVAHFFNAKSGGIRALLGVINSTVFELMLRSHLATGHISLSALRKVPVPNGEQLEAAFELQRYVEKAISGDMEAELFADAYVALKIYGLKLNEYLMVLDLFPKLGDDEKSDRRLAFEKLNGGRRDE